MKKTEPNNFPLRLYDLQKPVYAAAKKKKLSVNDTILYLLDVALKTESK